MSSSTVTNTNLVTVRYKMYIQNKRKKLLNEPENNWLVLDKDHIYHTDKNSYNMKNNNIHFNITKTECVKCH